MPLASPSRRRAVLARNRPPYMRGLDFYADSLCPLWQNTAGSSAATTNGQQIQKIDGIRGSTIPDIHQTTRGPFIYQTEGGYPVWASDSALNIALNYPLPDAPRTVSRFTVYIVSRAVTTPLATCGIASFGSGFGSPQIAYPFSSALYYGALGFTTNNGAGYVGNHDLEWGVTAMVFDGTQPAITGINSPGTRFYYNGGDTSPGFSGALSNRIPEVGPTTRDLYMYALGTTSGFNCVQRFALLGCYNAAHSASEVREMTDWIRRDRLPNLFAARSKPRVLWVGASILSANAPTAIPQVAWNAKTVDYMSCLGVRGGGTTPYEELRFSEDMAYHFRYADGPKVAVLYGGGNDYTATDAATGTPFTPAQQVTHLGDLARQARRAGAQRVLIANQLPRSGLSEPDRTTCNAALSALVGTTFDALIDFAGDATIGAAGANANTTYYETDQVHPKQPGSNIAGAIAQPPIDAAVTALL